MSSFSVFFAKANRGGVSERGGVVEGSWRVVEREGRGRGRVTEGSCVISVQNRRFVCCFYCCCFFHVFVILHILHS